MTSASMPSPQQRQSPLPQVPGQQQPAQPQKMGAIPTPMGAQQPQQAQQMSPQQQGKLNKLMPPTKPQGLDPVLIQTERENM